MFLLSVLIMNLLLTTYVHSNRGHVSHKQQNKLVQILNGNRNCKGYKLSQWNCGSAYLENKMSEIEAAVARTKPTVFCVSESNLRDTVDQSDVQIPGYRLLTSKTISNPLLKISRVVVYLDRAVKGKLREDLMSPDMSSVWIELGSGEHKLLIGCVYREHQYMKQQNNRSLTQEQQLLRWNLFIEQWSTALATGAEVHTIGDFNIDTKTFTIPLAQQGSLTKAITDIIIPQGVTQCVKSVTRWPQGRQAGVPVTIDHHWTTAPEKLSEVTMIPMGSSDHAFLSAVRYARNIKNIPQYITKRSYKQFDTQTFLKEIQAIQWWSVYNCSNVDEAVDIFTRLVCNILDREDMAPVRTFQQRRQYAPWLSEETKSEMANRDSAVSRARVSQQPEDWRSANALKNRCTRLLRTEKQRYLKQKLEKCEEEQDIGGIWKNIKGYLGWGSGAGAPTELTDPLTGQHTNSPKKNGKYTKPVL